MTTITVTNPTDDFKNELRKILHESKSVCVVFTKKDGTDREMFCTLSEERIPQDKQPKTETGETSGSALRVFDTEKQEWRSFRWDSIKEVRVV